MIPPHASAARLPRAPLWRRHSVALPTGPPRQLPLPTTPPGCHTSRRPVRCPCRCHSRQQPQLSLRVHPRRRSGSAPPWPRLSGRRFGVNPARRIAAKISGVARIGTRLTPRPPTGFAPHPRVSPALLPAPLPRIPPIMHDGTPTNRPRDRAAHNEQLHQPAGCSYVRNTPASQAEVIERVHAPSYPKLCKQMQPRESGTLEWKAAEASIFSDLEGAELPKGLAEARQANDNTTHILLVLFKSALGPCYTVRVGLEADEGAGPFRKRHPSLTTCPQARRAAAAAGPAAR
eukprot:316661-Chlamydomonas_euryale.AAC.6